MTIKLSDCEMAYQDKCNLGDYVNENVKIGCQCMAIQENSIIYKLGSLSIIIEPIRKDLKNMKCS